MIKSRKLNENSWAGGGEIPSALWARGAEINALRAGTASAELSAPLTPKSIKHIGAVAEED